MSCIAELPPSLRFLKENIIVHSTFSGGEPEFNKLLAVYNKEIDFLLLNGLPSSKLNKVFNIKVHAFIGDAPATAKICKCSQFNGYYSCLKCMHPGEWVGKMIFKNLLNISPRTTITYKYQVNKAVGCSAPYQGIKGPSHLASWIQFPDNVLIDYMHACIIGTFKSIFLKLFKTSNYQKPYYLGKSLVNIDKKLLKIALPAEFSRHIRSINDRHHYKANEYRTLAMYVTYGLFEELFQKSI